MCNKLVFVISLLSIFIILATALEWASSVNAQGEALSNDASTGANITTTGKSFSIITPWNTGNDDKNNTDESSTG